MDTTKQEVEQLKAALQTHSKALTDSLERGGLLPGPAGTDGLIPAGFEPQIKLEVSYNGKDIELGTFFRAGECTASPAVSFQSEVIIYLPISISVQKSCIRLFNVA